MLEKLTYSNSSSVPPVGTIKSFVGDNTKIPYGWKLCNGDWLDKDDYKDLFSIIGTSFGDSGNTFRLPDFQDKFPKGVASSGEIVGCCGGCNKIIDHTHTHYLEACGQSYSGSANSLSVTHTHSSSSLKGTIGGTGDTSSSHIHGVVSLVGSGNTPLGFPLPAGSPNSGLLLGTGSRWGTFSACSQCSRHGHGYALTSAGQGGGSHNHSVGLNHSHSSSSVCGSVGCCDIPNNTDSRPEYQAINYIIKY